MAAMNQVELTRHPIFAALPPEIAETPTFEGVSKFLAQRKRRLRIIALLWIGIGIVVCSLWILSESSVVHWPLLVLGGWATIGASIYARSNSLNLSDEDIVQVLDRGSSAGARLTSGY